MKKKIILIAILSIFIVTIALFAFLYLKTDFFKINKNLTMKKYRNEYIISDDITLSNYINKEDKTLVIFWATWCEYCLQESEALNEYINQNPYNSVIIVSHDDNIDELNNYLQEKGYNWFVIFDPEKTIRETLDPGSKGIPSSYLLDNCGNITNFHKGKLSFEQFQNFFNGVEI